MSFQCVVVTPDQQLFDEPLTQAVIPLDDGLMGILTDRAPLLAKLAIGPLRVDPVSGQTRYYLVEGGIAQMKGNKLTILTSKAIPAGEISAESARAELAEAEARQPTDAKTKKLREDDLRRARAKRGLLEHK
jgi:F-type H+-transporting ATPase subunit epsilon